MDNEPRDGEDSCRNNPSWKFPCYKVAKNKKQRVSQQTVSPKLNTLKPISNPRSGEASLKIMLKRFPKISKEQYPHDIKPKPSFMVTINPWVEIHNVFSVGFPNDMAYGDPGQKMLNGPNIEKSSSLDAQQEFEHFLQTFANCYIMILV